MGAEPWRLGVPVEEEESEAVRLTRALLSLTDMLRKLESEAHALAEKGGESYETRGRLQRLTAEMRELSGLKNETEKRLAAVLSSASCREG